MKRLVYEKDAKIAELEKKVNDQMIHILKTEEENNILRTRETSNTEEISIISATCKKLENRNEVLANEKLTLSGKIQAVITEKQKEFGCIFHIWWDMLFCSHHCLLLA